MSRIGKLPIQIPSGVKVAVADNTVTVEGPKGKLSQTVSPLISVEVKDNAVVLSRQNDERESRAFHGLYRSLVKNMVEGVSKGYKKTLVITGVGFHQRDPDEPYRLHSVRHQAVRQVRR